MDIHSVRLWLKTKSIYDIPLRVTYYARVSSESDEQLNSLGNQITYYEDLIKRNRNWTFVPGYIDEGLSGISTKKRENFNRMIEDAAEDKFDLVITKEISRFARNTLDSIQFTRQLLSHGVGVFFQNDNINTLDEDSELRLSIMSSIAQDELRKLSSRVKFGHQQAIKDSVVLGNSRIFGYVKDGGRLVIDEAEAAMVRELFELYATDQYSMKQIENIFWEKGYRNHNGKRLAHTTMSNMIANPKYKGYYVGNKVKVIDMFTKKQKFLPPEEWVMFKDESGEIVPAIVSEELWDTANAILKRRSDDVKSRQGICNHANLLTGKLYCTCCGTAYYRRESKDKQGNKNSRWVCSGKIKNGADSCPSFPIYEEEIKPLILDVARDTKVSTEALIEEYVERFQSLDATNQIPKLIDEQKKRRELAQKKKSKLLEYNVLGSISDADFIAMNKQCAEEIADAEAQILELEQQLYSKEEFRKQIEALKATMRSMEQAAASGAITKEFVDEFIDKILVTPESDGVMRLDIKIFTGDSTQRYFEKLASRTGHTFKKIWLMCSYVLVAALATMITLGLVGRSYAPTKLEQLEGLIGECFIGEADPEALEDAAASAMVSATGDRWSYYIPASAYETYQEQMENAYVGVGITIQAQEDDSGFLILSVTPGGPAEEAGLKVNDLLILVDDQDVRGMDTEDVRNLVKGEQGTSVSMTVLRVGDSITLPVERRKVETAVATYQMLEGNVGLVTIRNFDGRCASETIAAIEGLLEQGAEKFLFDVRNNPGGYAEELIKVLDYLLPEGEVFHTVTYDGQEDIDYSDAKCLEKPMAVLVNGSSYSAAEFFAAALQENEAAVVVGEKTVGKGYFQTTFRLSDGSAVSLSIGKYFTPKGENLAGVGVTPDRIVAVDEETAAGIYYGTVKPEEDPQIQAALKVLQ